MRHLHDCSAHHVDTSEGDTFGGCGTSKAYCEEANIEAIRARSHEIWPRKHNARMEAGRAVDQQWVDDIRRP